MRKLFGKRGQSTVEFSILFGAILFFFVVFIGVIQMNIHDKNKEKNEAFLRNVARDVRDEISFAASSVDGYTREFYVPKNILGLEYDIILQDDYVFCNMSYYSFSYKIVNVSGQIKKGNNVIRKDGGMIYVNS